MEQVLLASSPATAAGMSATIHAGLLRHPAVVRRIAEIQAERARDPRMPFEFEHRWGIKTLSQLILVLEVGHREQHNILDLVLERELDLGRIPDDIERQLDDARLARWHDFDRTDSLHDKSHH